MRCRFSPAFPITHPVRSIRRTASVPGKGRRWPGCPGARKPLYPEHSRSGIRRIVNYVSFAIPAAVPVRCWRGRPDVIFVYHPPLTIGLPAWVLSRLWRLSFVYQVR